VQRSRPDAFFEAPSFSDAMTSDVVVVFLIVFLIVYLDMVLGALPFLQLDRTGRAMARLRWWLAVNSL
jgi:hypothetical protein